MSIIVGSLLIHTQNTLTESYKDSIISLNTDTQITPPKMCVSLNRISKSYKMHDHLSRRTSKPGIGQGLMCV